MDTWTHQYISNAETDHPVTQAMDWHEAQQWCNFTLFKPGSLPKDVNAFLDERYGQHEGVWEQDGSVIMVICKPTASSTTAWFLDLIDQLI